MDGRGIWGEDGLEGSGFCCTYVGLNADKIEEGTKFIIDDVALKWKFGTMFPQKSG